ncbi:MAG: site-specific integrase [Ilumatobacteraceae bacterium]
MARGSVFRKDNGWAFRVDAGVNPESGRRRQMLRQGFTTKKDAEAALAELSAASQRGAAVARTTTRVSDYLADWLVSIRSKIRASTHHSYAMAVDRINARLGHLQLQSLTPLQIERFYTELLESGSRNGDALAPKTVRNTHVVLRKALADAERLGLVSRNAAGAAKPPAPTKRDMLTWSSDELRMFLTAIDGTRLEIGFRIAAATGLRRGEVLGLRWRDVDFDLGQIAVAHTITRAGKELVMGPPKTPRSRRNVYLDKRTLAALKEHRKHQREQRLAVGPAWDGGLDLVVCDEIGRPILPEAFSRAFDLTVAGLGVPRIRLHDLRHTHATLALKAGVHPKVVSERLGHATVGVTLDLYSHVVPAIARDAAEQIMSATYGDEDTTGGVVDG